MLEIHLKNHVPMINYQNVLGNHYAFADEAEVLLPPFLKMLPATPCDEEMTDYERSIAHGEPVHKYRIELCDMSFSNIAESDEEILRSKLDQFAENAAETLDKMRTEPDLYFGKNVIHPDTAIYLMWKRMYQTLLELRMNKIWKDNQLGFS